MPITINGSGTVTGLSVGGLPDGTVTSADIANGTILGSNILDGTITAAKLASGVGAKVIQVVDFVDVTNSSVTGDLANDDTIPQNTEGGEIISASFTPVSATSHLYVQLASSTYRVTNQDVSINLFTGASASAFASVKLYTTGAQIESHIVMGDIASISTSTVTFSARLCSGTTSYTNGDSGSRKFGGALKTRLRIIEVAA